MPRGVNNIVTTRVAANSRCKQIREPDAFAKVLPRIRRRVRSDLKRRGLPREKVLAAVVRLLETSLIRVGNAEYVQQNQSFGLTTMRDRHAKIRGNTVVFRFRGKSGVDHEVDLQSATLARVVKRCQDLPGQELFQYLDPDGQVRDVGSADVNDYLREISGQDIGAKIFAPGPEPRWQHRHFRNSNSSTTKRVPSGMSPALSSMSQLASETRRLFAVNITCIRQSSRPTWTGRC